MNTLIASIGGSRKKNDQPQGEFNYPTTEYKFEDNTALFETPFLFEAIVKYHKLTNNNISQVILVGTVHSCWQDIYGYCINSQKTLCTATSADNFTQFYNEIEKKANSLNRNSTSDDIEQFQNFLHPLEMAIEQFLSYEQKISVHILIMQYGVTEKESYYNYKKLCSIENYMSPAVHHEILLDITHSFRSMPIYNFLIINYLMRVSEHNVSVSAIYYGMFELKSEEHLNYTTVINMNYLISTMNLINGLNEMNSYGSVDGINECLKNDSDIAHWLQIFEWASNTNNYNLMTKSVLKLSNTHFDIDIYTALEKDALEKISLLMKKYFTEHKKYKIAYMQLELSKWFFEQRRYGLAIITIQECLKSYVTYLVLENTPKITIVTDKDISDETTRNNAINQLHILAKSNIDAQKLLHYYKTGKAMRNATAHVLQTTNSASHESLTLISEVNEGKTLLYNYIQYVSNCMNSNCIEIAFRNRNNRSLNNDNTDKYNQLLYIGKNKKKWSWENLIKKYGISTHNLKIYEPENYICDYQTVKNIKAECKSILKHIQPILSDNKTLIILGNTNFEKMFTLINLLNNMLNSSSKHNIIIDIKLLGEGSTSEKYIYVTDKNIPQL